MSVGSVGSSSSETNLNELKSVEAQKIEVFQEKENLEKVAESPVTKKELIEKVDLLNEFLAPVNTSLKYQLHEKLER
ncbi:flagellar protein FlaG [Pseudalkalibacillus decolorationis]|uniref:flagellar protein FlaG n=1 Tax=Pseudalkalibacillus decolorationis TaxID=163879 RepID=UPI002148113B|nr:flagellar protein FlaG [Pseudalkalibacillus decolorationis]